MGEPPFFTMGILGRNGDFGVLGERLIFRVQGILGYLEALFWVNIQSGFII